MSNRQGRDVLKDKMRIEAYLKHLESLKRAKPKIETRLAIQKANKFLKLHGIKVDADRFLRQNFHNFQLVREVNRILRTTGVVKSFGKPNINGVRSRIPAMQIAAKEIMRANMELGLRLREVKPKVICWHVKPKERMNNTHPKRESRKSKLQKKKLFKLPHPILAKYGESLQLPDDAALQRRLFRPCIFFDIQVKGLRAFGRVVMQLFTEACPAAVLQLTRICASNQIKRMKISRVFPNLWVGCEMMLDGKTMQTDNIEYDMRALDHGSQGGILSFSSALLQGCIYNYFDFSISFRPIYVLEGRRLAFGRVIRGLEILRALQEFGSKNGVLSKKIYVSKIGLVH